MVIMILLPENGLPSAFAMAKLRASFASFRTPLVEIHPEKASCGGWPREQ
jgi:hypothetical protein